MKIKFLLVFLIMLNLKNTLLANETVNLFNFSFEDIDGNQINLEKSPTSQTLTILTTGIRCNKYTDFETKVRLA